MELVVQDHLWISTRAIRRPGDVGWTDFVSFIGLPRLQEIRSIDSWCNPYVGDCGDYPLNSIAEAWERIQLLPVPRPNQEYYLLYMDALVHPPIMDRHFKLLGHDLSDETRTSSLLNCGQWTGKLQSLAARVGTNGLLSLDDAKTAQNILPEVWANDPHSAVTIWANYEFDPH